MPRTLHTYALTVLGCKVNQYDARQIAALLEAFGLRRVEPGERADLAVTHTCGVTAVAAQKSRQAARKLHRLHENPVVLLTGCAADDELTLLPNLDPLRVPAGPQWLDALADRLRALGLVRIDAGGGNAFPVSDFGNHARAFLKVQDGCDIGCAYCIIPRLRKAPRDKPLEAALEEARNLLRAGYREIVVAGVSVGLYGRAGGPPLAQLLRRIADLPGAERVRLSSLHPAELTDELLDVWAARPNVMPHLHLSLQSGADAVLHAMRRNYDVAEYLAAVERARAALDRPTFTTDVIVGFPGETEALFSETLEFCRRIGFLKIHVFPYSPRPQTPAAALPDRIPGQIAAERAARLRALGNTLAERVHREQLGRTLRVLTERIDAGIASGYDERYVPCRFPADAALRQGRIVPVLAEAADADGATGTAEVLE